jgi:hypothetical protein
MQQRRLHEPLLAVNAMGPGYLSIPNARHLFNPLRCTATHCVTQCMPQRGACIHGERSFQLCPRSGRYVLGM